MTEIDLASVEQAVKKLQTFTIQDLAGQTGLSTFDAKQTVDELMKRFVCRLQVTDRGELVYDFGSLVRRGRKTIREQLRDLGQILWKAFTYFFKVWIMLMLVGYFVLFVLLLVAIVVVSMSTSDRDRGISLDNGAFSLIFRIATEFFFWNTITGNMTYRHDRHGYRYRWYEPVKSDLFKSQQKSSKKKFIIAVFDYVFGPHRAQIHPLENQREVATYIRKNKGIITIEEVRALAGWKGDQADEFFTEMVSNFDGEIKVSDKGVIYGDFTEFMSGKNPEQSTDIVFYWDEFEPEYILNGNTSDQNLIITGMNLFVLLMSYAVLNGRIGVYMEPGPQQTFQIVFGIIPFVYASLFFVIPLVRSLINNLRDKQRRLNNIRKRLMKEIYQSTAPRIPLAEMEQTLNSSTQITDKVNRKHIEHLMTDEIYDWKGEPVVTDDGEMVYDFTLLRESQTEAREIRSQREIGVSTGKTVYDTSQD